MKFLLQGGKLLSYDEYQKLGFKSGLEIHQQLDTEKKLFCRCPVGLIDDEPDARILRHMRPTLSELGEYDGTALMEFKTRKEVIYQLFRNNICTYEMDDTPPFPVNQKAVDIAIEIALLFNCSIVDEVHIVRKQYLDGSIPTGFQRTAVIGLDGWIPYKDRKIRIRMVTLEEDACREVSDEGHTIVFRTDRLSTPLVEIITHPDILSPEEVEEVNWLLAEVLRSSGKVRRGIGTVRQDVNVSISGGTRVEIKGVSKIGYHAALTHNEAMRQNGLLEIARFLQDAAINTRESFDFRRHDVIHLENWTKYIPSVTDDTLQIAILATRGIKNIINYQLQPGITFADEISSIVKVVACLDKLPNMTHSVANTEKIIPPPIWKKLLKEFNLSQDYVLFLVWGKEADVKTALGEIEDRLYAASQGVPNETRQAFPSGVTHFERVLPGPDRMYPDTDSSPTRIMSDRIEKISSQLPPKPWEIRAKSHELGIPENMITLILRSGNGPLFWNLVQNTGFNPKKIAVFIAEKIPYLKREGFNIDSNNKNNDLEKLFKSFSLLDAVTLDQLISAYQDYLAKSISFEESIEQIKKRQPGSQLLETEIQSIISKIKNETITIDKSKISNFIIGRVKTKLGSNIDPQHVKAIIDKYLV